jgi:hypothetical protein
MFGRELSDINIFLVLLATEHRRHLDFLNMLVCST